MRLACSRSATWLTYGNSSMGRQKDQAFSLKSQILFLLGRWDLGTKLTIKVSFVSSHVTYWPMLTKRHARTLSSISNHTHNWPASLSPVFLCRPLSAPPTHLATPMLDGELWAWHDVIHSHEWTSLPWTGDPSSESQPKGWTPRCH